MFWAMERVGKGGGMGKEREYRGVWSVGGVGCGGTWIVICWIQVQWMLYTKGIMLQDAVFLFFFYGFSALTSQPCWCWWGRCFGFKELQMQAASSTPPEIVPPLDVVIPVMFVSVCSGVKSCLCVCARLLFMGCYWFYPIIRVGATPIMWQILVIIICFCPSSLCGCVLQLKATKWAKSQSWRGLSFPSCSCADAKIGKVAPQRMWNNCWTQCEDLLQDLTEAT